MCILFIYLKMFIQKSKAPTKITSIPAGEGHFNGDKFLRMAKVISYTLYGPVMIITEVIRLQGHYILGPIWVHIGLDTVGKVLVDFVVFD